MVSGWSAAVALELGYECRMKFATRVGIDRRKDHFVLHFFEDEKGDSPVASIVLPLTSAIDLGIDLFQQTLSSIPDLQKHFGGLNAKIEMLNKTASSMKAST